ncbi:MAG TPA: hypothetical protein VFE58_01805 [Tepidisphaeraceae bacterium]|jgi:integrase|nr:hypothetical protein [Tepidisphaeraceae bacterium]
MPRTGRKQKPYETSWKEIVPGLTRCKDGRWRISLTEQRFTESDERRAVEKAKKMLGKLRPQVVTISAKSEEVVGHAETFDDFVANPALHELLDEQPELEIDGERDDPDQAMLAVKVPGRILWPWLREQLLEQPDWIGEKVGIRELASLRRFEIPKAAIRVQRIIDEYKRHSMATAKAKNEAVKPFLRLVNFTGGRTLEEATSEDKLLAFRQHILDDPKLTSSGTISAIFNRIRSVIKLAGRGKLDAVQIDQALSRCKAKLYAPPNTVIDDPRPISRPNFHTLLQSVSMTDVPNVWRALLLMGLNAALYMEDLCDLRWASLDLEKGTFISRRKKRGRCLRVATLWPETIEALNALPRRAQSPYVFTSTHGTRYNKNTKINDFKDFREKAGVPDVKWSHIRDGAYSSACNAPGVDEKFARLLDGHKAQGLQDKYVLRNPQIVKPACDAVYRAYFSA